MGLIKPIAYWNGARPVLAPPPAEQFVYLCGYNFYQWKGTRLGEATAGGIAKISLDGTLDTAWTTNANPTNTRDTRFVTALNGNLYSDIRMPGNQVTKTSQSTGNRLLTVDTSGGSIWGLSALEGNNFFLATGDNGVTFNGTTTRGVGKILEDLTVDATYRTNIGTGPNGFVDSGHTSADRIAFFGRWSSWNGLSAYERFVVLNYDGTRDTGFVRTATFNGNLSGGIFIDGKWIVGGSFTTYGGVTYNRILAFNPDGTLNTTFNTNIGTGANNAVAIFLKINDTQFLIAGSFSSINGQSRTGIAVINTDGTLPANIYGTGGPMGYNNYDNTGKLYLSGDGVSSFNGISIANIISLNTDGTTNTTFNTGTAPSNGMRTSGGAVASSGGLFIR